MTALSEPHFHSPGVGSIGLLGSQLNIIIVDTIKLDYG